MLPSKIMKECYLQSVKNIQLSSQITVCKILNSKGAICRPVEKNSNFKMISCKIIDMWSQYFIHTFTDGHNMRLSVQWQFLQN